MQSVLKDLISDREKLYRYQGESVLGSLEVGRGAGRGMEGELDLVEKKKKRKKCGMNELGGRTPIFLPSCLLSVEKLEARWTGLFMKTDTI